MSCGHENGGHQGGGGGNQQNQLGYKCLKPLEAHECVCTRSLLLVFPERQRLPLGWGVREGHSLPRSGSSGGGGASLVTEEHHRGG